MTELSREMIETLVRQIVTEKLMPTKQADPSGVMSIELSKIDVAEDDRLGTGSPAGIVYTKNLFSLKESPRLGCGLAVMKDTAFDWTLEYDEINYIVSGQLDILVNRRKIPATAGEVILIPKSNEIQFPAMGDARFVYVTYPVNWQSQ